MEFFLIDTLAVALVIAAETLVSTREIGRKYEDEIDNQKELLLKQDLIEQKDQLQLYLYKEEH